MKKEELIAALQALSLSRVVQSTAILENNHPDIKDILELSLSAKKEIAFRAAWMLEYLLVFHPDHFSRYTMDFLAILPEQKNPSAMRHYAKMVALLTDSKADPLYQQLIPGISFEPVIDSLFSWLIDPKTPVAVKVHSMQSLANLSPRHDWLKEELLETIAHLIDQESIAFFARAKMIRKQLKKVLVKTSKK